jgi:hypothetical protein
MCWWSRLQDYHMWYCLNLNKPYLGKSTVKPRSQIITLRVDVPIAFHSGTEDALNQGKKGLALLLVWLWAEATSALPVLTPTFTARLVDVFGFMGSWSNHSSRCWQSSLVKGGCAQKNSCHGVTAGDPELRKTLEDEG